MSKGELMDATPVTAHNGRAHDVAHQRATATCLAAALGTILNPDNNYVQAASLLALACCFVTIRRDALRTPH